MAKTCTGRCALSLDESAFGSDASKPDGLRLRCRTCVNADQKDARSADALAEVRAGGDDLIAFGTPLERTCAEALLEHGNLADAAEAVQLSVRGLRSHLTELSRRAAERGWTPRCDVATKTPEGYHVKGVSTYYKIDEDGQRRPAGQWVKTKKDADERYQQLLSAMSTIADAWKGIADPAPYLATGASILEGYSAADLCCAYPMGDPHLGMYAWSEETGAGNFDLDIAERRLCSAMDMLVAGAPDADTALIANVGDFFHYDNKDGTTTKGTRLDADTRWRKVLSVGIRVMRRCIDAALRKHKRVRVITEIGNHDEHTSVMLALCLSQFYEREPRVEIDVSPEHYHWFRFGKVLVGVTHGAEAKLERLKDVMTVDRAQDWGETTHRYFYTGHIHHDTRKELAGLIVESFRTLAERDEYHARSGYRSGQDMKMIVLHKEHGEVHRNTVSVNMLAA